MPHFLMVLLLQINCLYLIYIDDKIKAKCEKLGMIVTSNKRYTYISLNNNAKEIYTYLRLAGEINVLAE